MKIEYIKGDLFETDVNVILHGCNAQGVMNAGIAKTIRQKYPKAYERYYKRHQDFGLNLGDSIVVPCDDKIVINSIIQEFYGREKKRYVSYDAVSKVFWYIENHWHDVYGFNEIAMPQIGAGLGGGDWNVIATIIESELKKVQPVVYIWG